MKDQGLRRAMVRGGAAGFFLFMILYLSIIIYPPLGETVVGKTIGEFPTPVPLLDAIISALFGSSTDEAGILVVLLAVGLEVVLVGAMTGGIVHYIGTWLRERKFSGENK